MHHKEVLYKKQIAFFSALVITALVVSVWASTTTYNSFAVVIDFFFGNNIENTDQTEVVDTKTTSQLASPFESLGNDFKDISGQIEDVWGEIFSLFGKTEYKQKNQ